MPSDDVDANLDFLGQSGPLSHKLELLHRELRRRYGAIDQVGVAVYDAQTDILKTFIGSDSALPALRNYQAKLADVPSLLALRDAGIGRVIDDLDQYGDPSHVHTRILLKAGYRSSYTVPMFARGEFFGFIFYDSRQPKYFRPEMLGLLEPFARLISLLVIGELSAIRTLTAATLTMRHIASRRDCETGAHLERMARFCQIIARQLATTHDLSDEYIEHLFLFAPLHDIGKIAIPDNILLKPGPLTDSEFALMREHTHKGQELVDFMLKEFGFTKLAYTEVLRNLVLYHHEAYDGSGYPQGLKGEAIPIEARITTAADVLDALTSRRPYKPAWPLDVALAEIKRLAGRRLDPDCVEALVSKREEIEAIQRQFVESLYG
ncbi:MAG: HD domain-containing phosphohydrolase [Pseudomonadota bacterium]|mgnify:FL=1